MRIRTAATATLVLLTACAEPAMEPAARTAAQPEGPAAIATRIAGAYAGVSEAAIQVDTIEAVDFPSPALGCPQPGMAYPAVITPGHKVSAHAGDRQLDVRLAGQTGFVCAATPALPDKPAVD